MDTITLLVKYVQGCKLITELHTDTLHAELDKLRDELLSRGFTQEQLNMYSRV
jgi:hypothetical protein